MDFRQLVEKRASCRQFRPDPVPHEDLREMVRVAALAPSPANAQPWRFIAVSNREMLNDMARAVSQRLAELVPQPASEEGQRARDRVEWFSTFFKDAPAVVFVALSPYRAVIDATLEGSDALSHDDVNELRQRPDIQCIGAAVEHLLLAATDLGYGGCWLSGPLMARHEVEELLEIRPPWQLASMVAIGKPAVVANQSKERKPLSEIFEIRP